MQLQEGCKIFKKACDYDKNGKGYVAHGTNYCQNATKSNCPSECSKHQRGNDGDVDPSVTCGSGYEGCFVKQWG